MFNLNRVQIAGHLGQDPEIRFTAEHKMVATMSVATTVRKNGNEFTEWHRIVAWEKTAERCQKLKKGDGVFVEGRLTTRTWDHNGERRFATEVVALFVITESKKTNGSNDISRDYPQDIHT